MFTNLSRGNPPQKDLELANALLESARKAKDPKLASTICGDAETKLSQMKRTAKKTLLNPISDNDQALREGAAAAYLDLGEQWVALGDQIKAERCLKKAKSFG